MIERRQKAMKSYQCGECGGPIVKGEVYVRDNQPPGSKYYRRPPRIFCTTCWGHEYVARTNARDAGLTGAW